MHGHIFIKTFLVIFLAELGDKTQFATMAATANQPNARITILFAAAFALIASTLVAVLFGDQLTRWIPERTIKMTAGILFLVFGVLILRGAIATQKSETIPTEFPQVGVVGRRILAEAVELERLAFEDYRKLAERVENPELRRAMLEIADEEDEHRRLLLAADRSTMQAVAPPSQLSELPTQTEVAHHVADSDRPTVEHAIEHELGMAAFYRQLGRIAVVPSLRSAALAMAAAEESHAERLRAFLGQSASLG
jgi:rubrerythrin